MRGSHTRDLGDVVFGEAEGLARLSQSRAHMAVNAEDDLDRSEAGELVVGAMTDLAFSPDLAFSNVTGVQRHAEPNFPPREPDVRPANGPVAPGPLKAHRPPGRRNSVAS